MVILASIAAARDGNNLYRFCMPHLHPIFQPSIYDQNGLKLNGEKTAPVQPPCSYLPSAFVYHTLV